jgi:hypothetical protein
MATTPDPATADLSMDADPAAGADPSSPAPDMSAGYCIEIKVSGDGKISVGVESAAAEASEEGAESGQDEDYQSVPTIGDAVRLVREIYNHAGSLQSDSAGEDQMVSGYR